MRRDRYKVPTRKKVSTLEIKLEFSQSINNCNLELSEVNQKKTWKSISGGHYSFPKMNSKGKWEIKYDRINGFYIATMTPKTLTLQFINLIDVPQNLLNHNLIKEGDFLIEDYQNTYQGKWIINGRY